jgi:RNA polymerase sigma factor (sigma-70 family)
VGAEPRPHPATDLLVDVRWLRLLAARLAGGGADGDDLAQETMLVALGKAPAGEGLRPWLVVTARNLWRRRRRDENRRRIRDGALESPEPQVNAETSLERLDTLRVVADLVRALPDPYRATVLMRYFEGKSAAEIAAATGVPAGTVRWRLKEALDRLRAAMDARHGGDRRRWALLLLPPSAPPRGATLSGLTVVAAALVMVAGAPSLRTWWRGPSAARTATVSSSPQAGARPASPRSPLPVPALAPADGLVVTGVVRDPSGRPAAGAGVALFSTRETTLATDPTLLDRLGGHAITGDDGRFALPRQLPGTFVLTASHARFGPVERSLKIGETAPAAAELTLTAAGERLSGRIRDDAGPVIGARITAMEYPGRGPALRFGTVSGADGRYALKLPAGNWHVSASADGYAYAWAQVHLEGPSERDIVLRAAGNIGGLVVDGATGAPVVGAIVRVDEPGKPQGRTTTSNAAGYFNFGTSWPPADHRFTAWSGDRVGRLLVPASPDPVMRPGVRVVLAPGAVVTGRVLDQLGRPVAAAAVQLFESAQQIPPVRQVKADRDGAYTLPGLLPGEVFLAAEAPGRAPQRRRVTITAGGPPVDFKLAEESTLTGMVVRADGTPARTAELRLTLLAGPIGGAPLLAFRRVTTAAGGTFRIDGLAAGAYYADVQSRGEGAGRLRGALAAGEQARLTVRLSAVDPPATTASAAP